jgi:hypothetical protein
MAWVRKLPRIYHSERITRHSEILSGWPTALKQIEHSNEVIATPGNDRQSAVDCSERGRVAIATIKLCTGRRQDCVLLSVGGIL